MGIVGDAPLCTPGKHLKLQAGSDSTRPQPFGKMRFQCYARGDKNKLYNNNVFSGDIE